MYRRIDRNVSLYTYGGGICPLRSGDLTQLQTVLVTRSDGLATALTVPQNDAAAVARWRLNRMMRGLTVVEVTDGARRARRHLGRRLNSFATATAAAASEIWLIIALLTRSLLGFCLFPFSLSLSLSLCPIYAANRVSKDGACSRRRCGW